MLHQKKKIKKIRKKKEMLHQHSFGIEDDIMWENMDNDGSDSEID